MVGVVAWASVLSIMLVTVARAVVPRHTTPAMHPPNDDGRARSVPSSPPRRSDPFRPARTWSPTGGQRPSAPANGPLCPGVQGGVLLGWPRVTWATSEAGPVAITTQTMQARCKARPRALAPGAARVRRCVFASEQPTRASPTAVHQVMAVPGPRRSRGTGVTGAGQRPATSREAAWSMGTSTTTRSST